MHARAKAGRFGDCLQLRAPTLLVRAGHDEVQVGVERCVLDEGTDEQVAALFVVDAAEKQHQALALELRKVVVEGAEQAGRIARRAPGAVGDDKAFPLVQPEALLGQAALFGGRKQDAVGAAQDPVLGQNPVDPLFGVLYGEGAFEVRIEHAVSEDDVGLVSFEREKSGQTAPHPEPVHHDAVEALAVVAQPAEELATEPVSGPGRAEGVYREGDFLEKGVRGIVQADDLSGIADRAEAEQNPHGFRGAARCRVERADNVQDVHVRPSSRAARQA